MQPKRKRELARTIRRSGARGGRLASHASLASIVAVAAIAPVASGCRSAGASGDQSSAAAIEAAAPLLETKAPPDAPKLAAIAMQVSVFEKPSRSSKKIGYLRVGAQIAREGSAASHEGCNGGWYKTFPRGYVCVGEEATLDLSHPLVRAANVRPDLTKPLPYHYGFVRAVSPLYLRIPTKEEQFSSEFALQKHLDWWKEEGAASQTVTTLGANDVFAQAGSKKSSEMNEGELFGDPADGGKLPFWLQSGRQIPNVSGFKVPQYAVFANRVRRHTGLAFIGSVATGPESLGRRFGITTDLRLVPTTKVKPDAASAFHGVEIDAAHPMPFAFVRTRDTHTYRFDAKGKPEKTDDRLERRAILKLSGKSNKIGETTFRETIDGKWLKGTEAGFVVEPAEWPAAAKAGERWIDVSIESQVLILYEGKKATYATLVSTGADGTGDPKTTKSTIRGTFRIKNKHVTATMDSNERSGGGEGNASAEQSVSKDDSKEAKDKTAPDAREGKTIRRGQGTFELRDVPWVQYFEQGYALHTSYWHDVFGVARSHGCVNLSPIDAHRIFKWTDPPLPENWHGIVAGAETAQGTTIVVRK